MIHSLVSNFDSPKHVLHEVKNVKPMEFLNYWLKLLNLFQTPSTMCDLMGIGYDLSLLIDPRLN